MIDAIRTQTPQTRLLVQSLLPVNLEVKLWKILEGQEAKIVDINHRLQDYCERQQLTFRLIRRGYVETGFLGP